MVNARFLVAERHTLETGRLHRALYLRAELGVFVLEDGNAVWTPVETDIQDSRHVVLSGETLQEGTSIITGPYETVSRTLEHGESVESVESY